MITPEQQRRDTLAAIILAIAATLAAPAAVAAFSWYLAARGWQ